MIQIYNEVHIFIISSLKNVCFLESRRQLRLYHKPPHLLWVFVSSVQISGRQVRPVVAHNNTIRIQHGDELKHKLTTKFLAKRKYIRKRKKRKHQHNFQNYYKDTSLGMSLNRPL